MRKILMGLSFAIALAWAPPVLAMNVTQYSLEQHGNTVTQTFLISRPTLIPLSFSYCNGQSCGNPQDPDLACYVNLYNPSFADQFPGTFSISPLGNGRPAKLFMKSGNLAGFDLQHGYYDAKHTSDWNRSILSGSPSFGADGSVSLSFNQRPIQAFKNFTTSPRGRVCGISEQELANFKAQYGTAFDNVNSAAIKLAIVWQVDNPQYANPYDQTVTINGQSQPFKPTLTTSQPVSASDLSATLSSVSSTSTQHELQSQLTQRGYVFDAQSNVGTITNRLANNEPALVFVTTQSASAAQAGVVLVTGYNPKKDSFQVINPSTGKRSTVSYDRFMSQNPSFSFVVKGSR